jgi:PAS domain S-box-containing protein
MSTTMSTSQHNDQHERMAAELAELRARLREAEETLSAIRNGEVDSLVVTGPNGDQQVFTLKSAEQPYRIFVEQMLEGAVTLSEDGTILFCNQRFAEMVHSRLEKVIGSRFQSFVRAADLGGFEQIIHGTTAIKVRYVLTSSEGSAVPAQLAFCRLPAEEHLDAVCVVVTDLTEQEERRELATALKNLQAAQEQLQVQNDQLTVARRQAEAASEAKDNFLAALSHELRTPLTPVLVTAAAMAQNHELPPAVRDDLAVLRRNAELEARLIDDLLDITRIVRGKIELRFDLVDVHAVVERAIETCSADIDAKRLDIVRSLSAPHPHVRADAVRIQQIMWNLIRNAVKFTPEGGQIILRSHNDAAAHSNGGGDGDGQPPYLCVSVIDSGIGIDPAALDRLFMPFEQADRRITQRFGGLGLGLAISKRLAELHGGSMAVHSEGLDRGSTFTVSLPCALAPAHDSNCTQPASPQHSNRRLRILLVEDHDDTRRSMTRLLRHAHDVRDVASVQAALTAAGEQPFDLVISDIGLPDGSGLDLMRQLRQRFNLKGICLSGFGMDDDIARSVEAGFNRHLTKPIDLSRLETAIESLVD